MRNKLTNLQLPSKKSAEFSMKSLPSATNQPVVTHRIEGDARDPLASVAPLAEVVSRVNQANKGHLRA